MQTMFTSCPYCSGSGQIKTHESTSIEMERILKKLISQHQQFALEILSHPDLDHYLSHQDKDHFKKIAEKWNANLKFTVDDNMHLNDYAFYSTINGKKLEV